MRVSVSAGTKIHGFETIRITAYPVCAHACARRIYISGDTLMVDDLKDIPKHLDGKGVDLMLVHLGGTTIPSPSMPLLMVTMDAKQGLELVRLIQPDLTIPIHYE